LTALTHNRILNATNRRRIHAFSFQEKGTQLDGFCLNGVSINDVVVVEEDPDTLYVASVYDQGIQNPASTAKSAPSCGVQNWHEGINSPRILSLSKSAVIGVRDIDTVEQFCKSLGHSTAAPAMPQMGK
jgi:hypothetical protein